MSSAARDAVCGLAGRLCARTGVDLEDVEISIAGQHRQVRLLVDRDGGISLDECAELSREVSEALDRSDVMGDGAYTLEVSSPGVSRPLTRPRHWRRATGRLVRCVLADGTELVGRVSGADEEAVTLRADGGPARRVPFEQVSLARVQVEFRHPERAEEE